MINMQESLVVVVVSQKQSLHNVHKEVCQIGYLLVQLVHEKWRTASLEYNKS